jgi:TDG/mug DNA glycosylase family protein
MLAASAGDRWAEEFAAWAAGRPPQGSLRDGWDLARAWSAAGRLAGPAAGELAGPAAGELAEREAAWRYDGTCPRPRWRKVLRLPEGLRQPRRPTASLPSMDPGLAGPGRTIPDVIGPGLAVLFCGINPGLYSAATGRHFARPGNRFWPALHRAGFTPRQLLPAEQEKLLGYRLGVTNLVARATAAAAELTAAELTAGARVLAGKVRRYRPEWVAVVGVTAYRVAFGRPKATFGPQDEAIGGTRIWVLPNPSGLNAHYTVDRLAAAYAELRATAAGPGQGS